MKEKMNRKNLFTAGVAVIVVCLVIAICYAVRPGISVESTEAEEAKESIMESITVPEITVAETTTEVETEEMMEETEPQTTEPAEEESEIPAETKMQPVKTAKAATKENEPKPQVPEEATQPVREPEPQEVEPDHEEGEQPTAKPEEPQGGTTNEQGQVYVPGFGYVETGEAVVEPAHSNGDWDKQVGTMQ
ncbi:DUF6550 family protein [Hungatella sp.]|uniref:DUF6550 family protein n=1 Tax=Hungatella sp. TaxID=2613924 RepID=UPI002A7FAC77|nr:DUF6550 family protein [Hungatella sp.]